MSGVLSTREIQPATCLDKVAEAALDEHDNDTEGLKPVSARQVGSNAIQVCKRHGTTPGIARCIWIGATNLDDDRKTLARRTNCGEFDACNWRFHFVHSTWSG